MPERGRNVEVVLVIGMAEAATGVPLLCARRPSSVAGRWVIPETLFLVVIVLVSGVNEDLLDAEGGLLLASTDKRGAVPDCCCALRRRLSLDTFFPCLSGSLELLSLCIASAKALPTEEKFRE